MDEINNSRIKLSQLRAWSQSLFTAISVKALHLGLSQSAVGHVRSLLLKRWGAVTLAVVTALTPVGESD